MTSMISSPGVMLILKVSLRKRSSSASEISVSWLSRMSTPLCCRLLMCCPAIPTLTLLISTPDWSEACLTAVLMASTVSKILVTTPLFTPVDMVLPYPRISIFPFSALRPTMQATLVVPMSNPTMILPSLITLSFCTDYLIFIIQIDAF